MNVRNHSPERAAFSHPLRLRAVFWAVVLALGGIVWVNQSELILTSVYVGSSVPPIPGLAALVVLAAIHPLLGRMRLGLSRADRLFIYLFVVIAVSIPSVTVLTMILAFLTVPSYLATPENRFGELTALFPRWWAPTDPEVIRPFFEGQAEGRVPWGAWGGPLITWGLVLIALFLSLHALLSLFRRPWQEQERLTYPLLRLPLALMEEPTEGRSLWRDGVFWLGFGGSVLFNGLNMLRTFDPSIPAPGHGIDVGAWFVDRPWNALQPLSLSFRPEIVGIAYFMPSDVILTCGLAYLLLRLSNVVRAAWGQDVISTAYDYQEISAGAFIALMGILVWQARHHLRQTLRRRPDDAAEPLAAQVAWAVAVGGYLFVVATFWQAGMAGPLAALHVGLLVVFGFVYARMRAETGATTLYLFPFWQQQTTLLNFLGSDALAFGRSWRSLGLLASAGGLSRGVFPALAAYSGEGMALASLERLRPRAASAMLLGGLGFGLVVGMLSHLMLIYRHGFNLLDGGRGYRMYLATQQFSWVAQWLNTPLPPQATKIGATLGGAVGALVLSLARWNWLGFPFHPLGFAMATAYGYHLWAPFLFIWLLKGGLLRWSGIRIYRRWIPFFVGIVLGHYLFTGAFWGGLGALGWDRVRSYVVQFG